MLCPKCHKKTEVLDSRQFEDTTRRGRRCKSCGHRFRTLEVLQEAKKKKPDNVVPFKPKRRKKKEPERHPSYFIVEFDPDMSDDELEAAIFEGSIEFDDDGYE